MLIVEIQPVDNLANVKLKKHTKKPMALCPGGSKPEVFEEPQENLTGTDFIREADQGIPKNLTGTDLDFLN